MPDEYPDGFFVSIRINNDGEYTYLTQYKPTLNTFFETNIQDPGKWTNDELNHIIKPFNFEFVSTNHYKLNYDNNRLIESPILSNNHVFEAVILSYRFVTTTNGAQYNFISTSDSSSSDVSSCKGISKIVFEVRETNSKTYDIDIANNNNSRVGRSVINTKLKVNGTENLVSNGGFLSVEHDGDHLQFQQIDAPNNIYRIKNIITGRYCSVNDNIMKCVDVDEEDHGKFYMYDNENDGNLKLYSTHNKLSSGGRIINWPKSCHPCNGRIVCDYDDDPVIFETVVGD